MDLLRLEVGTMNTPHRPRRAALAAVAALLAIAVATHPPAVHAQSSGSEYAAYASPDEGAMALTTESDAARELYRVATWELDNVYFLRAHEHAMQALELDPEFGLARAFHGFVMPGLQTPQRLEQINTGLAAIALSGTTAEMLVALAYRELVNGNAAAARDLFGTAKAMNPEDPHLAFRWAQATAGADGPQAGLLAFQKVTAAFPESAPAYNNIAYGQYLAGNQQGGLTAVRRYGELNPGHPNPHDSYAELLQWAGRLDAARAQYEASAAADAEFDQAHLGLAEIAQLTGNPDEAQRQIMTAIQYAPSDQARINYTRALGNAYLLAGDWQAAMEQFGKAAAEAEAEGINGVAVVSYRQMALTDAMGDGSAFEEYLAKAEEIQGNPNAASNAFAGFAHGFAGNTEKARAEAKALEESAQGGLVNVSRALNAMLELEAGDAEAAMEQLSQADPTNPIVRAFLAETYSRLGMALEAEEFKNQVLQDRTFDFFNPFYPVAYLRAEAL